MDTELLDEIREAVEATPDVPLEIGPAGPYCAITAFTENTWNNDVLCGPNKRAYGHLFANARRWLVALLEEVERLRTLYDAQLELEVLSQQVAAEKIGRLEAQLKEAREWAVKLKRERDALREFRQGSGWTPEREWDEADQVCLCPDCGSEMDFVRPGEWQCRTCEIEEMLKNAGAVE